MSALHPLRPVATGAILHESYVLKGLVQQMRIPPGPDIRLGKAA